MTSVDAPMDQLAAPSLAWDVRWLTAARCRAAVVAAILFVFVAHVLYIQNCPIDLAEDETYYWDWSRQLDFSFYSKGPVTALLIRASCAIFGESMTGVRLPALVMGAGLSLCTYWLTRRLFGSERLALGAVLLAGFSPMLSAAGLVMTTDPTFLFCWALTTCMAAVAIFSQRRWAWLAVGAVLGMGFLTKFTMAGWLIGLFIFLWLDGDARQWLRTRWPYLSILVALPSIIPVLIWNMHRGWVTFLHVGEDMGLGEGGLRLRNVIGFWTGQMVVMSPLLFALIMAATVHALWDSKGVASGQWPASEAARSRRPTAGCAFENRQPATGDRRAVRFLLCMALPIFVIVIGASFRKHAAENWAAPSYFATIILTARFISRRLASPRSWRLWRLVFYPALGTGMAIVIVAHDTEMLYPVVAAFNARYPHHAMSIRKLDATYRLHGWSDVGRVVARHVEHVGGNAIILAGDYQTTAEMAFYVSGRPKTYCAGSYFRDPSQREPFSQYDIWNDRRLDEASCRRLGLLGRDAIYIGPDTPEIRRAFDRIERLEDIVIIRHSLEVRRLEVWKCIHFKGMLWPGWNGKYNK